MAPRQQAHDPSYLDENHQRLAEFAAWAYEDDPEEGEVFLNYHMEKRGYQRSAAWSLPPEQPPAPQGGAPQEPQGPRRPAYFKR